LESVSGKPPRPSSALPPVSHRPEAGPKAISGRTSYLQVRLAFHPYPQLIRAFCNRRRCEPPRALTRASLWPWVAHLVSGLPPATHRALVRLGFPAATGIAPSASPRTVTRRFVLQKARDHATPNGATRSRRLSAHGFRICFTPRCGVLFTFPSRYWCTIGRMRYAALEGGPPCFRRDVACPAVLPDSTTGQAGFAYGTLTRCGRPFQQRSATGLVCHLFVALPHHPVVRPTPTAQRRQALTRSRFRLIPFRSPLLRE
jgi:hypothetical protein